MKDLEFAALMCSRLCHDLISPVTAFANGLEVLTDEDDPEMKDQALALLQNSARQAAAKLQFARLAYGAASAHGADIELAEARQVVELYLGESKADLQWEVEAYTAPKDVVRLLLNFCLLAVDSVPRGGRVRLSLEERPDATSILAEATGKPLVFPEKLAQALGCELDDNAQDARSIQPTLTRRIVDGLGGTFTLEKEDERLALSALVPAAPGLQKAVGA
ncbi:MAG: histidine phosphotransferase family protein [Pseudomonadota bacterium]